LYVDMDNQINLDHLKEQGVTNFDLRKTVYKYRTIRGAAKIIKSSQVYFSPADKLNDTQELNPDNIDLSFTKETKERYWQKSGLNDVTDAEQTAAMVNSVNNYFRKGAIGIFSAGKTPVNLHLWQQYGAKHTGVCFGFRSAHKEKVGWHIPNSAGTYLAFNVNYTDEPRLVKFFDPEDDDLNKEIYNYWFNTKRTKYIPEDEIRVINEVGSGPEIFEKKLLYEVVFGELTPQESIDFILKLLMQYEYPVQRIGRARIQDGEMVVDYIARL
jgi:hypothetical protein